MLTFVVHFCLMGCWKQSNCPVNLWQTWISRITKIFKNFGLWKFLNKQACICLCIFHPFTFPSMSGTWKQFCIPLFLELETTCKMQGPTNIYVCGCSLIVFCKSTPWTLKFPSLTLQIWQRTSYLPSSTLFLVETVSASGFLTFWITPMRSIPRKSFSSAPPRRRGRHNGTAPHATPRNVIGATRRPRQRADVSSTHFFRAFEAKRVNQQPSHKYTKRKFYMIDMSRFQLNSWFKQ